MGEPVQDGQGGQGGERAPVATPSSGSSKVGLVVVAVVVALALLGVGAWWFLVRDTAPSKVAGPSCGGATTAATSADGVWSVADGADSYVGYRIQERFGGDTVDKTAVGRTSTVSGSITIAGSSATKVDITADLTQLKSDSSRRDAFIRDRALETNTYPEARFVSRSPVDFGGAPAQGVQVQATAKGDLTLHGQTRSVELPVAACWTGERIEVTGSAPITLADYGISPPDIGGLVKVADKGELELKLVLQPGA